MLQIKQELPTDKMTFLFEDDEENDNILISGEELNSEENIEKEDTKDEIKTDVWTLPSPFTPDGKLKVFFLVGQMY